MEVISNAVDRVINLLFTIGIADIVDILIVAYIIYKVIWFVRRTNSYNLAKGLMLLLVVQGASEIFNLTMINFLLRSAVELGFIALLILFQPELRRVLERVGRTFSSSKVASSTALDAAIAQTVLACTEMSASRTGALIIFERKVNLNAIMSTGTIINADISAELTKNLFYNKAPLHDGALIMRGTKIAAAGCVLPLTQSTNLSKELGMRHRAGIGLSEQSDAVIVIVSEETGSISVAVEGMLKRHLTASTLDKLLHSELVQDEEDVEKGNAVINFIKKRIKVNKNEENESDKKTL